MRREQIRGFPDRKGRRTKRVDIDLIVWEWLNRDEFDVGVSAENLGDRRI